MLVNTVTILVFTLFNDATIASAISPAINAYSIAVTPRSSLRKRSMSLLMMILVFFYGGRAERFDFAPWKGHFGRPPSPRRDSRTQISNSVDGSPLLTQAVPALSTGLEKGDGRASFVPVSCLFPRFVEAQTIFYTESSCSLS